MKEQGTVIKIEGDSAMMRFARSEACEGCKACKMGAEKDMFVRIQNTLDAKVGDVVEVELEAKRLLSAGAWAYLFPLAMLFLGLAIGYLGGGKMGWNQELAAAFGALAMVAAAYLLLKRMNRYFAAQAGYSPAMCGIINNMDMDHNKEE